MCMYIFDGFRPRNWLIYNANSCLKCTRVQRVSKRVYNVNENEKKFLSKRVYITSSIFVNCQKYINCKLKYIIIKKKSIT